MRLIATLAAAAFSIICCVLELRIGFNVWDEGFLWYGIRRVLAGEVPIRDFMSYDIGRYYLAAAAMTVFQDDGILALRLCVGLVQTFGVALATYLVLKDGTRPRLIYALLAAVIFVSWMMVMQYKSFDTTASIMLIAALAFPPAQPEPRRWFIAGTIVGIAAMLGRNHGLYGVVAIVGAVIYAYWGSSWREACRAVVWFSIGVTIGYLPNLVMLALVPGFASASWDGIKSLFDHGTNLWLPIPWPWVAFNGAAPALENLRGVLVGVFFIALPAFGVCGLIYAAYLRRRMLSRELAVFVAAALLAIPYTHYAYSRADVAHLSFGIFPLLVGLLALPGARPAIRCAIVGLVLAASVFVTLPYFSGYQAARQGNWRETSVDGDVLKVAPAFADEVVLLERLAARYACNNRSFLATPYWPGAYAVLRRKSPVWEIYALFPRGVAFQEQELARIKAADLGFVVIADIALDGREELRYKNTHPLIEKFVRENFILVKDLAAPAYLQIYAREDAAQKCS